MYKHDQIRCTPSLHSDSEVTGASSCLGSEVVPSGARKEIIQRDTAESTAEIAGSRLMGLVVEFIVFQIQHFLLSDLS